MKKYGFDDDAAASMLALYPADRIRWQLRGMAFRRGVQHPGRYLRRAIERDFELPDEVVAERRAALRAASSTPPPESHQDAENRRIAAQLAERAVDELLGTLAPWVLKDIEQRAAAEIEAHAVFSRAPTLLRNGMMRAAMIRMAREQLATTR